MNRREFLAVPITLGLTPLAARAQGVLRRPTIGVLMAGTENSPENAPRIAAFREGLRELGWREGENVEIVIRWSAGKNELVQQYANELLALSPDVILANSTTVISALKRMSSHPGCICAGDRPRWARSRTKLASSGRQLHRLHLHRSGTDREMDGASW